MPWASVDPMGLFGLGDAWNIYKAGWIGAWEGAVILADEVTFHAIDSLHDEATRLIEENGDSHLYGSYAGKVFREATIAAVTVGVGSIARGGLAAGGRITQAINWASQFEQVRKVAQVAAYGLSAWDLTAGAKHFGTGIGRVVEGDYWGLLDIGIGALQVISGADGLTGFTAPRVTQAADMVDAGRSRTNLELIQEIAKRAHRWGTNRGYSGNSKLGGTKMHRYADKLLTRYQRLHGDRGLSTEVRYHGGVEWGSGMPLKNSVILDVVEGPLNASTHIFDYKFGIAGLSPSRVSRIRCTAGLGPAVPITEVRP
jgi:hypothetical protein